MFESVHDPLGKSARKSRRYAASQRRDKIAFEGLIKNYSDESIEDPSLGPSTIDINNEPEWRKYLNEENTGEAIKSTILDFVGKALDGIAVKKAEEMKEAA